MNSVLQTEKVPFTPDVPFATRLQRAISDLRAGRPIVLTDDHDREDEADLIVAAEKLTPEVMAMMIRDCSGIVCVCLPPDEIQKLGLEMMVATNESRYGTAFTVTIEAREGVTTGVSAKDRTTTILAALSGDAHAIASPGHVFPLRARAGGVRERRGHTEGSVDLARLAGLKPAGVLCELTNPDGTMTRGDQLIEYAIRNDLVMISIAELADHLQKTDKV